MSKKDLQFLTKLDERLHKKINSTIQPAFSDQKFTLYSDNYAEKKISEKELQKVFKICDNINYVLLPINTANGCALGFDVRKFSLFFGKQKVLLRFIERQLPENWGWDEMCEEFMKPKNVFKAKLIGEKITKDYGDHCA